MVSSLLKKIVSVSSVLAVIASVSLADPWNGERRPYDDGPDGLGGGGFVSRSEDDRGPRGNLSGPIRDGHFHLKNIQSMQLSLSLPLEERPGYFGGENYRVDPPGVGTNRDEWFFGAHTSAAETVLNAIQNGVRLNDENGQDITADLEALAEDVLASSGIEIGEPSEEDSGADQTDGISVADDGEKVQENADEDQLLRALLIRAIDILLSVAGL